MTDLPVVSARRCVKALQKAGFYITRQNGSHIIMRRDNPKAVVVVPNHKELKPGTLRGTIRDAGMTVEEFVKWLNE